MSNVWGLDVDQVRRLSSELNTEASTLAGIVAKLTSMLSSTQWSGPDAERFRSDWESVHARALRQAETALRDTAEAARRNADQQESASS